MTPFDKALSFVLGNEGGYSNDPDDRGGATNLGITQSTLDRARRQMPDLPEKVEDLTREPAAEIYRVLYWEASKADMMPYPLSTLHFDAAVNHGEGRSRRARGRGRSCRVEDALGFMPVP